MSQHIDELISKLRKAADELEVIKKSGSDEDIKNALETKGGLMSCCGTCTLVSPTQPCANTCIKLSPFM